MSHEDFKPKHRIIGRTSVWTVFVLSVIYAFVTFLGFLSLKSSQDPIGEPFFTIMEILIILISPVMVISMVIVYVYSSTELKLYSFIAVIFMICMAVISSSVHFVVLTVGHKIEAIGLSGFPLFFSFKWPSVVYALDILAWDWFFALSMLFAAPVFKVGKLEKIVRILMIISGVLSLIGLIGVPLGNMQIRNIGIIGYGVVAPIVFLLLSKVFKLHSIADSDKAKS